MKRKTAIAFGRPERFESWAASGRIWTSRCGMYRVRESYLIGEENPVYYALTTKDGRWVIAGRHKRRTAAIRNLEKAARERKRNMQRLLAFAAPPAGRKRRRAR